MVHAQVARTLLVSRRHQDALMDVPVCIPWRPQPERVAAFERITAFWRHFGFHIILADSDPTKPFNLSAARNNAVRQAAGAELVIIADADSICDISHLRDAVEYAGDTTAVWPFNEYRYITPAAVDHADLLTATITRRPSQTCWPPPLVAPTRVYWDIGGFDERFNGWGGEDDAFYLAANTLHKTLVLRGIAYSFDHPADRRCHGENRARYELYKYAAGKPQLMRELIR